MWEWLIPLLGLFFAGAGEKKKDDGPKLAAPPWSPMPPDPAPTDAGNWGEVDEPDTLVQGPTQFDFWSAKKGFHAYAPGTRIVTRLVVPKQAGRVLVDVTIQCRRKPLYPGEFQGYSPDALYCTALSIARSFGIDGGGHLIVAKNGEEVGFPCSAETEPDMLTWQPRLIADGSHISLEVTVPMMPGKGDLNENAHFTKFHIYGEVSVFAVA